MLTDKLLRYLAGPFIAAIPVHSQAAPLLPDAFSSVQLALSGPPPINPRDTGTTFAIVTNTSGGASGTITANTQPSPRIDASVAVDGTGQAIAHGFLQYFFAVSGPTDVFVPVIISASSQVSQPLLSQNISRLFLGGGSSGASFAEFLAHTCLGTNCETLGGQAASFSIDAQRSLRSNDIYNLQLTLSLIAQTSSGTTSSAGFIDPIITIDPSFARANEFELVFSAGVGNSSIETPLPAALPLFATVLAGGGLIAWRRKRKATSHSDLV